LKSTLVVISARGGATSFMAAKALMVGSLMLYLLIPQDISRDSKNSLLIIALFMAEP
jgi:hypothetical protein